MICDTTEEESAMIVCNRCKGCAHPSCIKENRWPEPHAGPWFCLKCREQLMWYGWEDITQDIPFMDYIFAGRVPEDLDKADRVKRLAECYRVKGEEL